MKKNIVMLSAAILIMAVALLVPVSQAKAVTISQLNLELVVRPGETVEQTVQLYDDSMTGVTVFPMVYNFTADPNKEGAALILTDPKDYNPDQEWLKFGKLDPKAATAETPSTDLTPAEREAAANKRAETYKVALPKAGTLADFPYHIVVPQNAEPGTHLISLVFQTKPQTQANQQGSAVYIGTNVATNIFLKVLGNTVDKLEVDFQAGTFTNKEAGLSIAERAKSFIKKNFFLKPPVDFLVKVSNTGNTHQKPDGNIKIVNDLFGSEPEKLTINPENRIVLPDTERTFESPSFGQGLMLGKYRAKLTLLYGNPLKPVEKEVVFWIVPVVELLIVLGALLVIITAIIVLVKWRKRKNKKLAQEKEQELRQRIISEIKGQSALQTLEKSAEQKKNQDQPTKQRKVDKKPEKGKASITPPAVKK